ncbi:MAG: hypothetical protein E6Q83_06860 [Thiothrix sp.]|nr:MAG: hypothetical protein E6Q83_06860 [Thiothrix sp.]
MHTLNKYLLVLPLCCALSFAPAEASEANTAPHKPNKIKINPVPPQGLTSLDAKGLTYYQELGPLQLAAYQLPLPKYPTWRLYFALYPSLDKDGVLSGYEVKAQRINLSPLLYQSLVEEYGKENADAALNNKTPSDQFTLPYAIVQQVTADPIEEAVKYTANPMLKQACGLQLRCDQMWDDTPAQWSKPQAIKLERAPWDKSTHLPAALIRALAQQTNWLQKQGHVWQWVTPELPEGINAKRPWVEVVIDNYTGNGGMIAADWIERVADDSVAQTVTRIMIGEGEVNGSAYRSNRCARGNTKKLLTKCP